MVDEIKETEPVKTETEVKTETKTEDITPKPETKESVVSKIAEKITNFVRAKKEESVDSITNIKDSNEGTDIPNAFTEVALKDGWSQKDIEGFAADYSDADLLEMIPLLAESEPVETGTTEPKTETSKTEVRVENSQEDEKIKSLLDRIAALEKTQGTIKEQTEKQEVANLGRRVSQIFDDASKEFEVFGTTETLPKFPNGKFVSTSPQLKARNEVWGLASILYNAGMDIDNAMSVSLDAYKGKNLATNVKRNVIKDLKKNEQRLSGKRTSHESAKLAEYGPDVIKQIAAKHGRDIL